MYVGVVPNRSSPPAILSRESYREDGRVKKRTVANLSSALSVEQAEVLKRLLKGEALLRVAALQVTASRSHGVVEAVLRVMRRLDVAGLLGSRPCRERSLVLAMVAMRILKPGTKLAMTRMWGSTTLLAELGLPSSVAEDDLYAAMDRLIVRQDKVEEKLAERHLRGSSLALFHLTSSYVEGTACNLAAFGYSRDKKRGKRQINCGLLTDSVGRPIALDVFSGNTRDTSTFMPQVERLREKFGREDITLVGDRGMISGKHIEALRDMTGVGWVTALSSNSIRPLVREGVIQPSLFEEVNLFEFEHAEYPGERLIACRNPVLGRKRAHVRQELIDATLTKLEKVQQQVMTGKLKDASAIGVKVGRVINAHKVAKHIKTRIEPGAFEFEVDHDSVTAEAALDGVYVIRTSVPARTMTASEAVLAYKTLTRVERAFRTSKSLEMQVRPIHHWLADRVKAHLFVCMLAYYVRWHMQEAWSNLTYQDDDKPLQADPVVPAHRSPAAHTKASTRTLPDGAPAHSFKTLLNDLTSIQRNTCTYPHAHQSFDITTSAP